MLAEHRRAGRDWAAIASLTGDTPEAARKRLARAADRVCGQLGLRPEPWLVDEEQTEVEGLDVDFDGPPVVKVTKDGKYQASR